jgi:hypothetical protein
MFELLGLIPKEAFADGEKPETKPDEKIMERKRLEAERAAELAAARNAVKDADFQPRKISVS